MRSIAFDSMPLVSGTPVAATSDRPAARGELEGRIALVTGASRGIGLAVCDALAAAGATVIGLSLTRHCPIAHASIQCDLTRSAAVRQVIEEATATYGPIDIVVNNAGVLEVGALTVLSDAAWDRMLGTNLTAVFVVMRATLPAMSKRGWGRIVNIASATAKTGDKYMAGYAATKHAVLGLTRSAALEVADRGVTVNAVCPSVVATDMTENGIHQVAQQTGRSEELCRRMLQGANPQKRLLHPAEVAGAVRFLVSDTAAGINGQAINLCGGGVTS